MTSACNTVNKIYSVKDLQWIPHIYQESIEKNTEKIIPKYYQITP